MYVFKIGVKNVIKNDEKLRNKKMHGDINILSSSSYCIL